jgi:acetoacetyl-CoA synthetase
MPIGFWNDPDDARLIETYFSMYPGVWCHGDWIEITSGGSVVISGRSDSTINRAGVRIGTAEIYRAVLADEDVLDAVVVDVPRVDEENWMPLFVVLRGGVSLDEALERRLKQRVREYCSPRHVPNEVRAIAEVPRTLSGKVLEVPVKRVLLGMPPSEAASLESLANPRSLDPFVEIARGLRAVEINP